MWMAYQQAGWGPNDVDLVECHAAGTPLGDAVETESLRSLWGRSGWEETPVRDRVGQIEYWSRTPRRPCTSPGLLKMLLALKNEHVASDG